MHYNEFEMVRRLRDKLKSKLTTDEDEDEDDDDNDKKTEDKNQTTTTTSTSTIQTSNNDNSVDELPHKSTHTKNNQIDASIEHKRKHKQAGSNSDVDMVDSDWS